jgi:hypothetical protein
VVSLTVGRLAEGMVSGSGGGATSRGRVVVRRMRGRQRSPRDETPLPAIGVCIDVIQRLRVGIPGGKVIRVAGRRISRLSPGQLEHGNVYAGVPSRSARHAERDVEFGAERELRIGMIRR